MKLSKVDVYRYATIILICVLVASIYFYTQSGVRTSSNEIYNVEGAYPGAPSYTVSSYTAVNGSTVYYAKAANDTVRFTSTNATDLITSTLALSDATDVFISSGTYILTGRDNGFGSIYGVVFPQKARHLYGAGNSTILKLADGINMGGIWAVSSSGTLIEKLHVIGNKDTSTDTGNVNEQLGIAVNSCQSTIVQNCLVENCAHTGIDFFNSVDCSAINNISHDNGITGMPSGALTGSGIDTDISMNLIVSDNHCYNNWYDGIWLSRNNGSQAVNNNCHDNGFNGLQFGSADYYCWNLKIDSNLAFRNQGYGGIFAFNTYSSTISNNNILNNNQSGISLNNCKFTAVTGGEAAYNTGTGVSLVNANYSDVKMVNIHDNDYGRTNTYYGISINGNSTSNQLIGNTVLNNSKGEIKLQAYGTVTNTTVQGNVVNGAGIVHTATIVYPSTFINGKDLYLSNNVGFEGDQTIDLLRGVTPSVANWGSAPANLSYATDGNHSTATTNGTTLEVAPNSEVGDWIFTLWKPAKGACHGTAEMYVGSSNYQEVSFRILASSSDAAHFVMLPTECTIACAAGTARCISFTVPDGTAKLRLTYINGATSSDGVTGNYNGILDIRITQP